MTEQGLHLSRRGLVATAVLLAAGCEPNESNPSASVVEEPRVRPYESDGSADQTVRMQRIVDAVARDGGGQVVLPDLLIPVRRLVLPSGVHVTGMGSTAGLEKIGSSATWLSVAHGAQRVTVSDIRLVLGALSRSSLLTINGTQGVSVQACTIENTSQRPCGGIELRGAHDTQITGCRFVGLTHAVKVVDQCEGVTIKGCSIIRWRDRGLQFLGTKAAAAARVLIEDNTIEQQHGVSNVRQPIQFNGDLRHFFRNVIVRGNTIQGNGKSHRDGRDPGTADMISLHATTDFEIVGNACLDGGEVGITVAHGSNNGRVTSNVIRRCDVAAIAIGSPSGPRVSDVVVSDNECDDFGLARTGPRPGWALVGVAVYNASRITIARNRFRSRASGITGGVSQQDADAVTETENEQPGASATPS